MSLNTWMAEFVFPCDPEATVGELLQWHLKKWIGLREENLEKHNCRQYLSHYVVDDSYSRMEMGNRYFISHEEPLCEKYRGVDLWGKSCTKCPLYRVLHEYSCWTSGSWWGAITPRSSWYDQHCPELMIQCIRKAIILNN